MNWEELIDVVSELVKDADIRKQIYTRMIDMHTHYSEDLKDNMGIDPAWDDAIKNYIDTDQEETDEDDYNYDYEEEECDRYIKGKIEGINGERVMDEDIVDRLRVLNFMGPWHEAANKIERLRIDNSDLRGSLQFIAMANPLDGQTWEEHSREIKDYAIKELERKEPE